MKWVGTTKIARLRKQLSFPHATDGFPRNGVWKTRAEIPYRWRVTTQIWVVFPIGCSNQKYYPHLGCDTLLVWNFAGKPVVASQNVDCFLRLKFCVYSSKTANPYLRLVYLFIQFDTIHRGSYMVARRYEITLAENEWNVYYINTNETPTLKYIFAAIYYNHNNSDLFTCERESLSGIHRYLQYSTPLMAVLSMTLFSISITPVNRD